MSNEGDIYKYERGNIKMAQPPGQRRLSVPKERGKLA
jgi:hypothetical protein